MSANLKKFLFLSFLDNKTIKIIGIDEKVEDENSKILAAIS